MEETWNAIVEAFVVGAPNLLVALAIFFLSLYLARVLSRILHRVLHQRKAPEGVTHLLQQLIYWAVIVMGTIAALQRFVDVTAFLAGLGIIGFTVGFALQDVMKNFASGIILLLQQPFHVGETIGVKGFDGTVLSIDLRSTEMRAVDGRIIILPNAEILANPIINYSRAHRRRVDFSVNLPHGVEPQVVRQIIQDVVSSIPGFIRETDPVIVFDTLTDAALELNVNFWIDTKENDPAHAKHDALLKVKSAFSEHGIEIPHPVQTVFNTPASN